MSSKSGRGRRQQPNPTSSHQRQEPEFTWEDLNNCYRQLSNMCVQVPQQINELIGNRDAVAALKNPSDVAAKAEILLRDVQHYAHGLTAIHRKHRERTGAASTPDEVMDQIMINEEYQNWNDSYSLVVLPHVQAIITAFASIEQPVATA